MLNTFVILCSLLVDPSYEHQSIQIKKVFLVDLMTIIRYKFGENNVIRVDLQWGAADAEIKVPSGVNIELKRSSFKAWSRSIYSHTCYASCQGFLSCLFLSFRSFHLHLLQNLSRFLLCWLWLRHGSCGGPHNKISHPAGGRFPKQANPPKKKKQKKKTTT